MQKSSKSKSRCGFLSHESAHQFCTKLVAVAAVGLFPYATPLATASDVELIRTELQVRAVASVDSSRTANANGDGHTVPYFPSASDALGRQGFARIVNLSESEGTVSIDAYDDGGNHHGPITLTIAANATVHINSVDLEDGEASKGLPEGTGRPTEGDWRLELTSELDIKVFSYIRTPGGFVTSMHDVAPSTDNTHQIWFFNPGSDTAQESLLRVINRGAEDVAVTISGIDDEGVAGPDGVVDMTLPAHAARTVTAMDLEGGASGLEGQLGDGAGKWRLEVAADGEIQALSMLGTPTGHLTNLSSDPSAVGSGADDRPDPPTVIVTGTREFDMVWQWPVEADQTYAFDHWPRINGGAWTEDCSPITLTESGQATLTVTYGVSRDLEEGTVLEARYRYRNSDVCGEGMPGDWSHIGKATVTSSDEDDDGAPDLRVVSPSTDNANLATGASFTLSATVENQGDGGAAATTIRFYLSENSTISSSDTEVGTEAVDALPAAATSDHSISLNAPSDAGTHYYGACVDAVEGEASSANNCSIPVEVTVTDG